MPNLDLFSNNEDCLERLSWSSCSRAGRKTQIVKCDGPGCLGGGEQEEEVDCRPPCPIMLQTTQCDTQNGRWNDGRNDGRMYGQTDLKVEIVI